MQRAWRAIIGGLAGTLAMSAALFLVEVQTRARLALYEALARQFGVPDSVGLGFLIFAFFGVVVWPLLFTLLESRLPPSGDPAVSGMLFSSVLWLGFVLLGTSEIHVLLLPFYAVVTLLVHLVYGFTMGLVYGWRPLLSESEARSLGHGVEQGRR